MLDFTINTFVLANKMLTLTLNRHEAQQQSGLLSNNEHLPLRTSH